jgi:hypothetical protein
MMAANFDRRAAQFDRLAVKDRSFAPGAGTFRRLAAQCRGEIERRAVDEASERRIGSGHTLSQKGGAAIASGSPPPPPE